MLQTNVLPAKPVKVTKSVSHTPMDWIRTNKQVALQATYGRYASVCFIVDNYLYTVGGGDQGSGYVEDMLKINLDNHAIEVHILLPVINQSVLISRQP